MPEAHVLSRRVFLETTALGVAACGLSPSLASGQDKALGAEFTLFYQPTRLRNRAERFVAWSCSITVRDGRLINSVPVLQIPDKAGGMGLAIAESTDGVHWREIESYTAPLKTGVPGFCLRWTGKEFVYFLTGNNRGDDRKDYPVVVRQYRSDNLKTWTFMGDDYTTRPDKRWYRSRWDELVILEDRDLFYGYITAEPHPHLAQDSLGMLKSADGVRWEVRPPPVFEWDGLPSQQMEVCFCERIKGRYYLGMGARCYLGHLGFSVMMFVGDSPTGPFRPDKETFRLCGNTTRDTNWLAKTFLWKGEVLLSNWITTSLDRSFPGIYANGQSLWIGPLKKLITDREGHARIAWWPGNEAAKGAPMPVDAAQAEFVHPAPKHRGTRSSLTPSGNKALSMTAGHDGAIALLPAKFDFTRGVIIEGGLKAIEPRGSIGTHWHAAAAGFFFEEGERHGMLVQLETLGLTRIGAFDYQPEPVFDADEFRVAAYGNTQRGGTHLGLSRFAQEDVIGPIGCAAPCGIRNATTHRFRLLIKHGIWELYLDDLYVQTYITGPASGRIGLFAKSGAIEFSDLRCWTMTPAVKKS